MLKRRTKDQLPNEIKNTSYSFPDDFLWGAATASHQVEGNDIDSDWYNFERIKGNVKNFLDYPEFARNNKSDHFRRFKDDITLMKDELGLKSYRFSVDWSRIEPKQNQINHEAMDYYCECCRLLKENNIEPMVTLFHWSSPNWIWDLDNNRKSGWYSPEIVTHYLRFTEEVVKSFGSNVNFYCTLNEPNVFLYGGFSEGVLAPGHKNKDKDLLPVLRNLLTCHAKAYHLIKGINPNAQIGIAHNFSPFEPNKNINIFERIMATILESSFTWSIPEAIKTGTLRLTSRNMKIYKETIPNLKNTFDFMGVNYYEKIIVHIPKYILINKLYINFDPDDNREIWPKKPTPNGFLYILKEVKRRYDLPIYITENGCCHTQEDGRYNFLKTNLQAVSHAINKHHIDVRGFYYWSLLDNLEWNVGFAPKFGLYEVDYENGDRKLRDFAKKYRDIISNNSI